MTLYESILCLLLGAVIIASFFAGQLIGMHAAINTSVVDCSKFQIVDSSSLSGGVDNLLLLENVDEHIDNLVHKRVEEELNKINENKKHKIDDKQIQFKPSASLPIKKLSYISKKDFFQHFDFGINETISKRQEGVEERVLLMHYKKDRGKDKVNVDILDSAMDATKDCDIMLVVGNRPRDDNHCLAYFNNYDNYQIQRFMRIGEQKIDPTKPLQHIGRGLEADTMYDQFEPPKTDKISKHWKSLQIYLNSIDSILRDVGKITKKIATDDNSVVVMVCNKGQVSLLINFICSAKSKGFDISMLLVFVTDKETYDIVKGLGVEVFYHEAAFGNIPSEHSLRYGDQIFEQVMWTKVICTHVISMLNHNFLFQDVDVVWYKHPLDFLNTKNTYIATHDIYFQGDGSQQMRFSPFSANSGFYFVKSNDKTRYLFTSLVYGGDMLWSFNSHQQVLGQLLAEHHSLFNLGVKILPKDDFPGGEQYHATNNYMENFILHRDDEKAKHPWIFHMSWTLNVDNKLKFMKQMGMWYLKDDTCENIDSGENNCCSATPLVSCHYKDKPSIIPCHDSPSLDKDGASFWSRKSLKNTSNS